MVRDFQQLARLDHFQQYLLVGQHQYVLDALPSMACDDPIAIWLRIYLRQDLTAQVEAELPDHYAEQWRGWRAYYRGDYVQASQHFMLAWDAISQLGLAGQADIALGLGKVYTRTGHWEAARGWLLHSLAIGRQQNRLFDVVQGYGALGELLLRAGHPQAAYSCLSIAYHSLPPGSGQRSRQLNYLASALLHCGELLRAESLLMTSIHLAHDSHDADSVWHALARLQFLRLEDGVNHIADLDDVTVSLQAYVPTSKYNPIALGFLYMGQALMAYQGKRPAEALAKIQLAKPLFGVQFPYEHAWALQWEAFLTDKPIDADATILKLLKHSTVSAPSGHVVLDMSWQRLPLPAENGFLPIACNAHTADTLLACRYLFFI